MTEDEQQTYALTQRENCRPMECNLDAACWVTCGGLKTLEPRSMSASPRCGACGGKLLLEQWRTPGSMGLSAYGRLSYRGRARSREPGFGDKGLRGGVPAPATPASGTPS